MAVYLAQRIIDGLNYIEVVKKRPDLKQLIDKKLIERGFADLIVEV